MTSKIRATAAIIAVIKTMLLAWRSQLRDASALIVSATATDVKNIAHEQKVYNKRVNSGCLPCTSGLWLNIIRPLGITIVHGTLECRCQLRASSVHTINTSVCNCAPRIFYSISCISNIPAIIGHTSQCVAATRRWLIIVTPLRWIGWVDGDFRRRGWIETAIVGATLTVNIIISIIVGRWPLHCPSRLFDSE